jgi:hypothetical protein
LPKNETDEFAVNIKINDLHEPDAQPIADADLPVLEVSKERYEVRDLILADGCMVPLKTEMACKGYGQLLTPPIRQQFCANNEMPQEPEDVMHEPQEEASTDATQERYKEIKNEERSEEKTDDGNNKPADFFEAAKAPEIEKESLESSLGLFKAVFLLKVMTVLLVMLLAIEAIIYFI